MVVQWRCRLERKVTSLLQSLERLPRRPAFVRAETRGGERLQHLDRGRRMNLLQHANGLGALNGLGGRWSLLRRRRKFETYQQRVDLRLHAVGRFVLEGFAQVGLDQVSHL